MMSCVGNYVRAGVPLSGDLYIIYTVGQHNNEGDDIVFGPVCTWHLAQGDQSAALIYIFIWEEAGRENDREPQLHYDIESEGTPCISATSSSYFII